MPNSTPIVLTETLGNAPRVIQATSGDVTPLTVATRGNATPVRLVTSGRATPVKFTDMTDEALAWYRAVIAAGGTVSMTRLQIVNTFIAAEKAAGTWALTDDYWAFWAENQTQANVSLKRRATVTSATSAWTQNRGYTSNGSSTFVNTGFIPSTMLSGTVSNCRLAAVEVVSASNANFTAGVNDGSNNAMRLINLNPSSVVRADACSNNIVTVATFATSVAFCAGSRSGSNVSIYRDGALAVGPLTPTLGVSLPTRALYVGAQNNSGTAASFRATATVGLVCIGQALSAGQEASQSTNVHAFGVSVTALIS